MAVGVKGQGEKVKDGWSHPAELQGNGSQLLGTRDHQEPHRSWRPNENLFIFSNPEMSAGLFPYKTPPPPPRTLGPSFLVPGGGGGGREKHIVLQRLNLFVLCPLHLCAFPLSEVLLLPDHREIGA